VPEVPLASRALVTDVLELLRGGLLDERRVALAEPHDPVLRDALERLGARVEGLEADPADEDGAQAAAEGLAPLDALVVDARARFAAAGDGELEPLRAATDGAWVVTRAVANACWIGDDAGTGGKILLLAPRPGDGPHAEAGRAALENMARTLSIEWSRHGIRTAALVPAPATPGDDVAALVAYLVSPAGDYFSGCRLDLTG
jgi:NAD(P)-dependent dehydrogenase (short-subunit alcohol dehydrogenase family)